MIYTDFVNGVLFGVSRVKVTCPFGKVNFWVNGTNVTFHYGIDMTPVAPIKAFQRAKVKQVGYTSTSGNFIILDHAKGSQSEYRHIASGTIKVKSGDVIDKGFIIGTVGNTGNTTGAHLDFRIVLDGIPVDPLPYLQGKLVIMPYVNEIIVVRPELPQLNVISTQLNCRDNPGKDGKIIKTLEPGHYTYLGKTPLEDGYEWGQIIVDNAIVYAALNKDWNTVELIKPKPFSCKVEKDGQVCEVSIKPL